MSKTKGTIICYSAGILFGVGWWFLIGTSIVGSNSSGTVVAPPGEFYVPGIVATIALVMINMVSWENLNGSVFSDGATTKARLWLFFWLALLFGAVIACFWIAFDANIWKADSIEPFNKAALIIHGLLILFSCLLYRFARDGGSEDGF
jgi:hypothetical protein